MLACLTLGHMGPQQALSKSYDAEFGPLLTWTVYAPAAFDDAQKNRYLKELSDRYGKNGLPNLPDGLVLDQPDSTPSLERPVLPSAYEGYTASESAPLRFCKLEKDLYFNERGKEVEDDTVLLTIVESSVEK
jgi:hypothetical protein